MRLGLQMAKSRDEYISAAAGSIIAIAGLVAALGQLSDKLKSLHDTLAAVPPWVIYLVSAVVALIGAELIRRV